MKKISAFIMLLLHMNVYMFLPQGPEQDIYDANGLQVDDINSVIEYIGVALGIDQTADDEDSDNGQNFIPVKPVNIKLTHKLFQIIQKQTEPSVVIQKTIFPPFQENRYSNICIEVATPPPNFIA